jgi:hypothetical protein
VAVVPAALTLTKDKNPLRLATPVQGVQEVRSPIGLRVVAFDATI